MDPAAEVENEHLILGSLDPTSPYQMAVYFNNRGATIERIELNNPRYQDLDDKSGYVGFMGLSDAPTGGCSVAYVAPGSPAEAAKIQPGDRIIKFGDVEVADTAAYSIEQLKTKPGENVVITVARANGAPQKRTVSLVKRPLSLISPEPVPATENDPQHQLSFLWTLGRVGNKKVGVGQSEIPGLPSLHDANWEMKELDVAGGLGQGVEFSRRLTKAELSKVGGKVPLEMVKRYRLTPVARTEDATKADKYGSVGYGIKLEMEIRNLGTAQQKLAYPVSYTHLTLPTKA